MISISQINPVARAVLVIGAVMALVTSITFAALSNSVTLADTSVRTATADLNIYNFETNAWADEAPGFVIDDLVPGTPEERSFYLQNVGDVPLYITARVPALPGAPEDDGDPATDDYGFTGFENVLITITGESCDETVNTNLLALYSGDVELPCNPLANGASGDSNTENTPGNYDITFDINEAAVTGDSAGVGDFDIVFTGSTDDPSLDT